MGVRHFIYSFAYAEKETEWFDKPVGDKKGSSGMLFWKFVEKNFLFCPDMMKMRKKWIRGYLPCG